MNKMGIMAAAVGLTATMAQAGETIVGAWKTASGETAAITRCGEDFCITVTTGKFAGRPIGRFSRADDGYAGTITDPVDNKTYSGSGRLSGNRLTMKGCVLAIFCKSQSWLRL